MDRTHRLLCRTTLPDSDTPVLRPLRSVAPPAHHVLTGGHRHVLTHPSLLSLHLGPHLGDTFLLSDLLTNILRHILYAGHLHPGTPLHWPLTTPGGVGGLGLEVRQVTAGGRGDQQQQVCQGQQGALHTCMLLGGGKDVVSEWFKY